MATQRSQECDWCQGSGNGWTRAPSDGNANKEARAKQVEDGDKKGKSTVLKIASSRGEKERKSAGIMLVDLVWRG